MKLGALSLKGHMESQHEIIPLKIREVEIEGGETSYLYGFLPPGAEYSDMPGAGLSGSSA